MEAKKAYLYWMNWNGGFARVKGTVIFDQERNRVGLFYEDGETDVINYRTVSVDEGRVNDGLVWFKFEPTDNELKQIFNEYLDMQIDEFNWEIKRNKEMKEKLCDQKEADAE